MEAQDGVAGGHGKHSRVGGVELVAGAVKAEAKASPYQLTESQGALDHRTSNKRHDPTCSDDNRSPSSDSDSEYLHNLAKRAMQQYGDMANESSMSTCENQEEDEDEQDEEEDGKQRAALNGYRTRDRSSDEGIDKPSSAGGGDDEVESSSTAGTRTTTTATDSNAPCPHKSTTECSMNNGNAKARSLS